MFFSIVHTAYAESQRCGIWGKIEFVHVVKVNDVTVRREVGSHYVNCKRLQLAYIVYCICIYIVYEQRYIYFVVK